MNVNMNILNNTNIYLHRTSLILTKDGKAGRAMRADPRPVGKKRWAG